jgi:hypothetical protein
MHLTTTGQLSGGFEAALSKPVCSIKSYSSLQITLQTLRTHLPLISRTTYLQRIL